MSATLIAMVRNEVDVLEAFVRHHAPLVDSIVVVDHGSIDGSQEVLHKLADEGLPLSLRGERSVVQRQNTVLTAVMREVAEEGADWVLPLDADEFLVSAAGAGAPPDLDALPRDVVTLVAQRTYVPSELDDPGEAHPIRRIRHRRAREDRELFKAIVPRDLALDCRYGLLQGNHTLVEDDRTKAPAGAADDLRLAHFPVRSLEQLGVKVLGGWPAHVARPDKLRGDAYQWKRLFRELVRDPELTDGSLQDIAIEYSLRNPEDRSSVELVDDPVRVEDELRFEASREATPLAVLATTAEALAAELAEALEDSSPDSGCERRRRVPRA